MLPLLYLCFSEAILGAAPPNVSTSLSLCTAHKYVPYSNLDSSEKFQKWSSPGAWKQKFFSLGPTINNRAGTTLSFSTHFPTNCLSQSIKLTLVEAIAAGMLSINNFSFYSTMIEKRNIREKEGERWAFCGRWRTWQSSEKFMLFFNTSRAHRSEGTY